MVQPWVEKVGSTALTIENLAQFGVLVAAVAVEGDPFAGPGWSSRQCPARPNLGVYRV
jgi:hypothetical protein